MAAEKSLTFNYAKYVFGKIEREFYNHSYPVDLAKTVRFINAIMNSQNLLRDIYIITKIKKLSPLGNYMLFMMKKAETGQINFENLIPNMEKDKEFILRILTEFFMTKEPGNLRKTWQDIHHEVKETIEEIEKQKEKEISVDSGNKFKIEELDNELVTEEFIDKNIEEIEAKQKFREEEESVYKTGSYLELIKNIEEEEKKAFNLPGQEQEEEQEEEQQEEQQEEQYDEQEEEITEKTENADTAVEQIKKDENAAFGFDDLETEIPPKEVIPETPEKTEKEEITTHEERVKAEEEFEKELQEESEKETIEEITASEKKPELEETKPSEEKIPEQEKEEIPEEITAEQLSFMNEPQEEEERTDYVKEEVVLTEEAEVQVNTKYREYESELITRNALIDTDLDELTLLLPYKSFDAKKKNPD